MIRNPARNSARVAVALRHVAATAFLLGPALSSSSAMAFGGGTGNDRYGVFLNDEATKHPPSGSADLKTCDKGLVWDAKKKKCVVKRSGVLPDDELTEYAYALAKAERYEEAIEVLDSLENPITPRALNYRGYSTRKLGRTEEGIGYYLQSVALDPGYAQVREYLGEAYVTLGKFDLATEQLATIQKICGGSQCEEYEGLAAAISRGQAEQPEPIP